MSFFGYRPFSAKKRAETSREAQEFGLSYSAEEMAVLTACMKECGIDYTEILKATQSESGRMAILSDANAHCLGKVVQTTHTASWIKRIREKPKSEVHIQQGDQFQELLDDSLAHQTIIQHTDAEVYQKRRAKVYPDSKPKYRSADICAIQLGVTSHLSASSGQVAGVMMLDGGRVTTAEGLIGLGIIPLYKATSHALFFPRLNIAYSDPDFLNRIQLVTVFSDGVKGGGRPAMSYSTLSVVRHNIVDAHFLPEALPWDKIEELYPQGVRGLKNFQVTDVAPAVPARISRTFSYQPLLTRTAQTVLNWNPDGTARVNQEHTQQRRNSISFEGLGYGVQMGSTSSQIEGAPCGVHGRAGCPCEQHSGPTAPDMYAAGFGDESSVTTPALPTACVAYEPQEVPVLDGYRLVGSHPFTVEVSANVGTIAKKVSIGSGMLKHTAFGNMLSQLPVVKISLLARLSGSASFQSSGCFYLCYDPNDTLDRYPSKDRAIMLAGKYFMPGRYDSVDLEIQELAVPFGFVSMTGGCAGSVKVVLLDDLRNFETSTYGMDLQLFVHVHSTLPKLGDCPARDTINYLPLRHVVVEEEITTTMTKGTCYVVPLCPTYPAKDGAQLYPSCSSSVLEAHTFWKGNLELEVVFSLPALAGGTVDISLTQDSEPGWQRDRLALHGYTRLDLRAQRIVRIKVPIGAWNGFFTAGKGSLFGQSSTALHEKGPQLVLSFVAPPIITDTHKKGKFWVRYIGIHDAEVIGATMALSRTGDMAAASMFDRNVGSMQDWNWEDPVSPCISHFFEGPRQFRIASITSWPTDGWLHIPCTPCCFFPRFGEGTAFKGEIEPVNYLAHRAQENAMWKGSLKYFVKVVRQSSATAMYPVVLKAYPNFGMATTPSFTDRNTYVVAPSMGMESAILATGAHLLCEVHTPGNKWYWTRYGKTDSYEGGFHPRWLSIQFPTLDNITMKVENIDIYVEANVDFFHAIPPFPLTRKTQLPEYYWKNTFPVD